MPQDDKDAATDRAKDKKVLGYLFDASQGSYMSIMKYCSDSSVRQYFYESRHKFATQGEYNNKPLILETLALRQEKAGLLGFNNYAELSLKFKMAESPQQIIDLFSDISQKAKPKSNSELNEIRDYFKIQDLKVWDL
jgi:oligopeptidase A